MKMSSRFGSGEENGDSGGVADGEMEVDGGIAESDGDVVTEGDAENRDPEGVADGEIEEDGGMVEGDGDVETEVDAVGGGLQKSERKSLPSFSKS